MKIKKRFIFFIIIFVVLLSLIYLITSTFSFNTLNFKPFYSSNDEKILKISYSLYGDDSILLVKEKKNVEENSYTYTVYKIKANNIEEKKITSFKTNNKENYIFFVVNNYAYFLYNNNKDLVIIDEVDKSHKMINNLIDGFKIINPYNNNLYSYNNNNNLYLIDYASDLIKTSLYYTIPNFINNIKKIDFIGENEIIISTYNSQLYYYDIVSSKYTLMEEKYSEYCIYDNKLYYTFAYDNKKMGVAIFDRKDKISFLAKKKDYIKMIIKDDYMYLINDKNINKISITRQKNHEELIISTYQNMEYSLLDALIVNEKLMYLPMIKKTTDINNEESVQYKLYRYKK